MTFTHEEGNVEGVFINAGTGSPIVLIVNGHNGFYSYGMFPHIQTFLAGHGVSSFSFNFSHGGIIGDRDVFEELDKYERNCMRLEVKDTLTVLKHLRHLSSTVNPRTFILAHSLGGVPATFSTTLAGEEDISISGLILLSCVQQLDFWPNEMINKWREERVYYQLNNRTKQLLPHGEELLTEILHSDGKWNVKKEIAKITCPILIVHGDADESVPVQHAYGLYNAASANNQAVTLKIVQSATHTYNTRHPFQGSSSQLHEMLNQVMAFITAT